MNVRPVAILDFVETLTLPSPRGRGILLPLTDLVTHRSDFNGEGSRFVVQRQTVASRREISDCVKIEKSRASKAGLVIESFSR